MKTFLQISILRAKMVVGASFARAMQILVDAGLSLKFAANLLRQHMGSKYAK
jgi:hypothetical protein